MHVLTHTDDYETSIIATSNDLHILENIIEDKKKCKTYRYVKFHIFQDIEFYDKNTINISDTGAEPTEPTSARGILQKNHHSLGEEDISSLDCISCNDSTAIGGTRGIDALFESKVLGTQA